MTADLSVRMTQKDIERLADAIHERMAKAVLSLPEEFKDNVLKNYLTPPVQFPMTDTNSSYFLMQCTVTNSGSLIFKLYDMNYTMYKEWVME
jgi:hypothetical protein